MINFFKRLNTNRKSRKLVHNVLEPMLNRNIEYCKGIAESNDFGLAKEANDNLTFVRQDITERLILTLSFDEDDKCKSYMLYFNQPGENLMHSQFLDNYSVRESGLIND